MSLPDKYDPASIEAKATKQWLDSGCFAPSTAEETYSIAIPPPNVTGVLHMGHALNGAIQDSLIRLARLQGKSAKWTIGTDHAGIALQAQVEKKLTKEGKSRKELGREAFLEECHAWRGDYGGQIIDQFKRIGASCDYDQERFTMDPAYSKAVKKVFIELYEEGLIYRDHYMINWDPGLGSAISDMEVDEVPNIKDTMFTIAYAFADGSGEILIDTVRPETIYADCAVAVNPEDARYKNFIGKTLIAPFTGREIPVIADDYVDMAFGTGALKITPGHDPNDFEIGRRHNLEPILAFGEDNKMNAICGELAGMSPAAAQKEVAKILAASGELRASTPHIHTVPFSQRSKARIEPLISLQWFLRMDTLAKPAIEAIESGQVLIHPESQKKRALERLRDLRPWCISRQLWWGHQMPVWYQGDEVRIGENPGEGWTQETDVLDTWFSSALWPFANLGWPEQTEDFERFYPTATLSTARDILFQWVNNMIIMGLRFTGKVPFKDVYVHSVIQAPNGQRMSKSLGTGIDPLDIIEGRGGYSTYGADALRYGLLSMGTSQDVKFNEDRISQGKQLATKLFNATRFALMQTEGLTFDSTSPRPQTDLDNWLLSKLENARLEVEQGISEFEFAKATNALNQFIYHELCDWFIEASKARMQSGTQQQKEDLASTLIYALRQSLMIAHPIMPFITEALWSALDGEGLLAEAQWNETSGSADTQAEAIIEHLFDIISQTRAWRDKMEAKPGRLLPARIQTELSVENLAIFKHMAKIELADGEEIATLAIGSSTLTFFKSDAIDLAATAKKLEAKKESLRNAMAGISKKLSNEQFTSRAPAAIIEKERVKLAALEAELDEL